MDRGVTFAMIHERALSAVVIALLFFAATHATTGAFVPAYATNLGTMPVEWMPIPAYSNTLVSGTNLVTFDPPDTNAQALFFRMQSGD